MSTPCNMANWCKNSPAIVGDARAKCAICRLSPDNEGRQMAHYWKPFKKKEKHPELERERQLIKALAHMYDLRAKYNVDQKKRKISRVAKQAEKTTERNIIHATKNSGRVNKDGDHVAFNSITLDSKLQTTRSNPIIRLDELEKVRKDAGNKIGGLVIRNKYGVGVVVFREEDLPLIVRNNE